MKPFWWIALAVLIALTSAVRANDWELVAVPLVPIYAKDRESCEMARALLANGKLYWSRGTSICQPHPRVQ